MGQYDIKGVDVSKSVQIAPGVHWVGVFLEDDPFQCHPYLIENGDESILIDPGSMIQRDNLINKIQSVCDLSRVKYIILHHQDPDLCAAVPDIEKIINRKDLKIVTHSRMAVLVKHYGIQAGYYNVDENHFELTAGNLKLQFFTTPYLHSPGAFVTYLARDKILFSGDLFGGLEETWSLYAGEDYYEKIEGFHMAYMPSRDILNYALRKIEKLDLEIIAPQHGSIILRQYIFNLIHRMKSMNCGLYIEKQYSDSLTDTIDDLDRARKEVQVSLDSIRKLKNQQDGDYFLTTLLLNPLMKNFNKSSEVTTDFVVYQYKKFLFKNKLNQLGGDICVTGNILFGDQKYTVLFNGDAMGKSIQGAGGALVMGTALNSIIHRSAANDRILDISPEKWMEETYRELHAIFQAFDGTMLVSGILGLLNNQNGHFLYINAEHPFPVLYRDSRAEFLQNQFHVRKFGAPMEMNFSILEVHFKPGDILILGSDGKDDIKLFVGDGKTQINEDEALFPGIVQESHGDLKSIIENLLRKGDLTDDLSLLRVVYRGEKSKIRKSGCREDFIHHKRIMGNLAHGRYKETVDLIDFLPEGQRIRYLYVKALSYYKMSQFPSCIFIGKEILQRSPHHLRTLKLLGLAYYRMQDFASSRDYFNRVLSIENNESIRTILRRVNERFEKQRELLGTKQGQA